MALPPLLALADKTDLAELLLGMLPLKALAVLSCTCRRLRALVKQQPAELWSAAARQAGFRPAHPLFRAPSIPSFLRHQHTVHANIAAKRFQRRFSYDGLPTPDGTSFAELSTGEQATLHVWSQTEDTSSSWPLPGGHKYQQEEVFHKWDASGRTLAVCVGEAWEGSEGDNTHASIAFIDTLDGSCSFATLPPQSNTAGYEEGLGLELCGWSHSSPGWLLVRHEREDGEPAFTVLGKDGVSLGRVATPFDDDYGTPASSALWSPSKVQILLSADFGQLGSDMWLWDVHTASVQHFELGGHRVGLAAFSPDGAAVLGVHRQGVTVVSLASGTITHQVLPGLKRCWFLLCGHEGVALISGDPNTGYGERQPSSLLIYRVNSHYRLTLAHSLSSLHFSPSDSLGLYDVSNDGQHLLASTHDADGLHVVAMGTGQSQQLPVQDFRPRWLSTADDLVSSRLLASDDTVLDFDP